MVPGEEGEGRWYLLRKLRGRGNTSEKSERYWYRVRRVRGAWYLVRRVRGRGTW